MTKYHKATIYLVCEGKIGSGSVIGFKSLREFHVAKKWIRQSGFDSSGVRSGSELAITKVVGLVGEITKVIAITTHLTLAEKKLKQYVKKYGFSKLAGFNLFIMTEPLTLNYDTTLVSVRRNYVAHRTILHDFVYHAQFNAKRYLPYNRNKRGLPKAHATPKSGNFP